VAINRPLRLPLTGPLNHPLYMKRLQKRHIALFGVLRDHFLFLTRRQIERFLTLPTSSTNRELSWLVSEGYLDRKYYADTSVTCRPRFISWANWAGRSWATYRASTRNIGLGSNRDQAVSSHTLAVYDVFVKFHLGVEGEADHRR